MLASDSKGFVAIKNIAYGVIPAVDASNFAAVRALAHATGWGYALGIHPLRTKGAGLVDLDRLQTALCEHAHDPQLVAVGEMGLDVWVRPEPADLAHQEQMYRAQLKLARQAGLPVVLHVRKSADLLLKHLRQIEVPGGIVHAFNGSLAQAHQFLARGFKLGFGGALTYPHATHVRALAAQLPLSALVLETDSPDIVPHWLYVPQAQRQLGVAQGVNTPMQLPRIAQVLAQLRGVSLNALQAATTENALQALPKMAAWVNREALQHA